MEISAAPWALEARERTLLFLLYTHSVHMSSTVHFSFGLYDVPRLRSKFGERAFSFSGPSAWNGSLLTSETKSS